MSGAEVGLWHSVGYLAQAEALHKIAAGKVSLHTQVVNSNYYGTPFCLVYFSFSVVDTTLNTIVSRLLSSVL